MCSCMNKEDYFFILIMGFSTISFYFSVKIDGWIVTESSRDAYSNTVALCRTFMVL